MKTKFSKSLIAMLLALAMVISVMYVGIIGASSAKVEIAEEGAANLMEVWFTRPNSWGNNPNVHYWGGLTSSDWPGQGMTWKYNNDYNQGVYYTVIPGDTKNIIFNNGNGSYQTVDISVSGKIVAYYVSGNETSSSASVNSWDTMPDTLLDPITYSLTIGNNSVDITSGTAYVTLPVGTHTYFILQKQGSASAQIGRGAYNATKEGTYKVTFNSSNTTVVFEYQEPASVYFADNTEQKWIAGDDAVILANGVALTKSVDEHTGWNVWYGSIGVGNGDSLTFKRVSKLDNSEVWNTWTTTFDSSNPCYVATSDTTGDKGTAPTLPKGTATDFWYGIWVDTKGNGNTKDFVKIYATDLYGSTDYYLYLPSYVNRSAVKLYTSLYELKIGSTSVPKGTETTVNLSNSTYNLSYKRYPSGSTHADFKLHVMKTSGTSAMLLTTKAELYAGLAASYAVQEDGHTADYAGARDYKESTSTKGDYLCYDANGNLLNPLDKESGAALTGLKKIKGRGNSTFEASMRLFGKYAYNITLNDKAQLIEGCESQKKYSLLANNADESLLRNATVYGIADAIGMPYTPNTRLIDLYDNGNYLGAYVLTEKVEYGKNTLIPDAKSLDKTNEDILAVGKGIDYDSLKQRTATYTAKSGTVYQYQYSYNPSGAAYEFDGTVVTVEDKEYTLDETYMKKHDFLLEHELDTRYEPEATWFISGRTKQAVVPKYPEFATQKEVQWMIEEYDALETAVFAGNYATFSAIADAESFASTYLIQELTMNLDAAATSYNILGGASYDKLLAAPLWDYDWAAGQYNGKKLTTDGSVDVADYTKVFVKKKSVKIDDSDGRTQSIPNLQAKMTQMSDFWTVCKTVWTNKFVDVLGDFLGDGKILLNSSLPAYRSAAQMNESRWHVMERNYNAAHGSDPAADTWGTRATTGYRKGSNDFGVGQYHPTTEGSRNYDNAVYYLNDWLLKRQQYMSSNMGLYDASLLLPDPVAYLDDKGVEQTTDQYTEIDSSTSALTSGWYAVTEDVSHDGIITVSGDVSLILCDGFELTVPNGIQLASGSSLTIYGQSEGTGTLRCEWDKNGDYQCIGISTVQGADDCAFTINGGTVIAKASRDNFFVGIGAYKESSAEITINGGTVTASGGNSGTGIGASYYSSADITINGGTVTTSSIDSCTSTGIGSNQKGDMTVTINGGTVCDTSTYSNCISIGAINGPGQVVINGGTVNASKMIGRDTIGDVTVTINGGIISSPYYAIKAKAINLSWTNESDSITVNSYYGTVTLKKAFTDGTNTYLPGVISDNNVLRGTTLTPSTATAETYLLGDVDGNGEVNILDATLAQRLIAGFTYAGADLMKIRGAITSDTISILDATAIQRYIAGFTNVYNVGSTKTYPAA